MNLGWLDDDLPARPASRPGPDRVDLLIEGEIDWALTARIVAQLEAAPTADELHLTVDSKGGVFAAAHDAHVAIRNHPARNKTATIRHAESAALFIAMAADRRFAVPRARIMLHRSDMQPPPGERWTAALHRDAAALLTWVDDQAADLFAHRTATPREVFVVAMQDEAPSSLEWCLETRIIHRISET